MSRKILKYAFEKFLASADIRIGRERPWDIQVHNQQLYGRVMRRGTLGLGEAYMDGWWDCERLDEMVYRAQRARLDERLIGSVRFFWVALINQAVVLQRLLLNMQNRRRALRVGEEHYDAGNDLYQVMLDKRLNYTCGYWKAAQNLDEAQEAKLKLVCDKLYLQPGMRLLDIGCGFGALAKYAAEHYGVSVVGITISKEQLKLGQELCQGLPVELRFQDYRELNGTFDRVVSLGMFEHVGHKNYRHYMKVAHRCLREGGLFLLHTIGNNISVVNGDPWINKYIFPNGMLPSIKQIGKACEKLFVMEDWHNFGVYYDQTLQAWHQNFNLHWPELQAQYSETFRRMWNFYLLISAGAFRARVIQLWQVVLVRDGFIGGPYHAVR